MIRHAQDLFQTSKVNIGSNANNFKVSLPRADRQDDPQGNSLWVNLILTGRDQFVTLLDIVVVIDVFHFEFGASGPLQDSKPPRRTDNETDRALRVNDELNH